MSAARDRGAATGSGEFLELVAHLSSRFVNAASAEVDGEVEAALQRLATFFELDRCALFKVDEDRHTARVSHRLRPVHEVALPGELGRDGPLAWLYGAVVDRGETVSIGSLDELPQAAMKDAETLRHGGVRSVLLIPLPARLPVEYFLSLASSRQERHLTATHTTQVRLLGEVFVGALKRKTQDITEQTLMRQQLRRAQQFAQSALNAFHKCLCVVDARGTVVEVSDGWPAFAQASGWAELTAGSNFFQASAATQGPYAAQARKVAGGVGAVVGRQQDDFAMELDFEGPAGASHFYTKVSHFELEGVTYAAISHEDITQRKNSEIELQNLRTQHWHSERVTRTGLLIASLAHELSQPLTAILSNAQAGLRFMAHDAPDLKEIGEILKDIASDDKRAGEIIESLRVMVRRQQSERQLIDLAALASEVTVLLKSELVATQVELECDFAAGCLALADRAQIQQVLLNLSMNAMEAMAAKPIDQRRLRIGVRGPGQGEVQISVSDSGFGITQEEFKKVFDAFWTTKSRGTGMGLAISRSIIESHGGRIWVDSRDGEGSTFFVSLPAAAAGIRASDGAKRGP